MKIYIAPEQQVFEIRPKRHLADFILVSGSGSSRTNENTQDDQEDQDDLKPWYR